MNRLKTATEITQILERIIRQEPDTLRAYVAREALEKEDPSMMFHELARIGCISGMISSLIYYSGTHAFFDTYYDEIESLREDMEFELGQSLCIKGDLKNFLAWFAFQETAYRMAYHDLELEL